MIEGLVQPLHLLVVLAVVLVVFGPGRLPALGESLGKSIRDFRKAMDEASADDRARERAKSTDTPAQPPA